MRIAILALLAAAPCALGDIVTYQYNGTVASNTPFTFAVGSAFEFSVSIDTDAAVFSQTATRAEYRGAVVAGYVEFYGERFNIAADPIRNTIIVRNNFIDPNSGAAFNAINLSISSDGIDRGPFSFPSTISLSLFDRDPVADTVVGLGLLHPLDTLRTQANGGVDGLAISMGVAVGNTFSSIGSGDGGFVIVPAPAAGALLAGGLFATRRRR